MVAAATGDGDRSGAADGSPSPAGAGTHRIFLLEGLATPTFLAALRADRIDASCVLDGPVDGRSFTAWVEQFLYRPSSITTP